MKAGIEDLMVNNSNSQVLDGLWTPNNGHFWDPTFFVGPDNQIHMIYLMNDASLQPHERHTGTRYAHATTEDLINIVDHGEIMAPDDNEVSLWTGNTIVVNGTSHMLHTIRSNKGYDIKHANPSWMQSIGYATSTDLKNWKRQNEKQPVSVANGTHYAMWEGFSDIGNPTSYRDPQPFIDPATGDLYMVFSARTAGDDQNFNGCVGLAKSLGNFYEWENMSPILDDLGIGEAEVPQIIFHQDKYYVFFTTHGNSNPELGGKNLGSGLYGFVSDSLQGHYEPLNGEGLVMDYKAGKTEILYGVRLLDTDSEGKFAAVGWVNIGQRKLYPESPEAGFIGKLSPAFTIKLNGKDAKVLDQYTQPSLE